MSNHLNKRGADRLERESRRFRDAPIDERCKAVVTLADGTTADCGRRRAIGDLCTQHAKMTKHTARRTADHTPTPWEVGDDGIVTPYAGDRIIVQTGMDSIEADQDFIVRAVNSHDALVAACKEAREFLEDGYPLENISPQEANLREQLESALALAEPH